MGERAGGDGERGEGRRSRVRALRLVGALIGGIPLLAGCATAVRLTTWPLVDPRPMTYVVDLDEGCVLALGNRVIRSFGAPGLDFIDGGEEYGPIFDPGCALSPEVHSFGFQFWLDKLGLTKAEFLSGEPRVFVLEPGPEEVLARRGVTFFGQSVDLADGAGFNCMVQLLLDSGVAGAYLGPNGRKFVYSGSVSRGCTGWFGHEGGWLGLVKPFPPEEAS